MRHAALLPHRIVVTSRTPTAGETAYDRVTSALLAGLLLLALTCGVLIAIWLQQISFQQLTTGDVAEPITRGVAIESNRVENRKPLVNAVVQSPEGIDDEDTAAPRQTLELMLNNLQSVVADGPATLLSAAPHPQSGVTPVEGDGQSVFGQPRSIRRWVFDVQPPRNTASYLRMLDQFGIELGAVFPDGRIVYLSHADGQAVTSTAAAATDRRFFTTWSHGELQQLDEDLFRTAGVDVVGAEVVHLFSKELEQKLARLETAFAGRSEHQIQQTWFEIGDDGGAFGIHVTRQTGAPTPTR